MANNDNTTWTASRIWLASIVVLVVLTAAAHQYAGRKLDRREPPVVRPYIPYLGHVVGMILQGGRYTKRIATKSGSIITLPMPGSRMYIVTDPSLAAVVQKTKTLSFNPIIPQVTRRVLGLDDKTVDILATNIGREHGLDGFYPETHDLVYAMMTPGDRLDELTQNATEVFRKHIEIYADELLSNKTVSEIDLLLWTQHIVTIATAEFLHGPDNIIAENSALATAFWEFDHGLGQLLAFADLMPSITARKAYRGREAVVAALVDYFKQGKHERASSLTLRRAKIAIKYGMSWDGVARSELSFLFAGIVNTAITSFWILVHIFARPHLLESIREEIQSSAISDDDLSATNLMNKCPLLLSVYRETLRLGSENSSNRLVISETVLADQYFLAKDSIVQISGAAMHVDRNIWGDDVADFDPYRFMVDRLKERSVHPSSFRAFGGGVTICPGRHFATREILYIVATIIMKFDIEAIDGGSIAIPQKKDDVLPVHILEPKTRVRAKLKPRQIS